jgi:tRNA-binding EMAP/Myf-like protein
MCETNDTITIDDFLKVKLRVARVVEGARASQCR